MMQALKQDNDETTEIAGRRSMLAYVRQQTVTITIGVAFFVFGFFIAANIIGLTERDILVGLVSGAIGGVTMLMVSHVQEHRSQPVSVRPA